MKVPLNWLRDYVDINVSPKEYADAMTMSGSKVEGVEVRHEEITRVVTGRIAKLEKHPDADRLQVSLVDIGTDTIQIVTGATNISVGDVIPVALDGSTLAEGKKITRGKLRGVESEGMMCSIQELGLSFDDYPDAAEHGIFILDKDLSPGRDVKEVLGLDEAVVEFEITSNRPDCFSITGIARESAATLATGFRRPDIKVLENGGDITGEASVEILDPDLCPRYAARIVKDIKIAPSPRWLRDRLKAAGVRPINNIVDITNYVMLELGQPMHAFDLANLEGKSIIVRRARDGELMKTLDDQDRTLDSSMLVIADAAKPVAVAGVMGGANSEVTGDTGTILFESACFDGISVRLTAKKLGMRTEASGRFEKGLDPENVISAVDRAVQLVEQLGAGTVCRGVIDCYPKKAALRTILFRPEKINALLGTSVTIKRMVEIFNSLEFTVNLSAMTVAIPSFRPDIIEEADLAEEVARFYGYNNIEAKLLEGKAATMGKKSWKQKVEDIIRQTMLACGLSETYTYSFASPKVFDLLGLPAGSELRRTVTVMNPLGEDFSIMRTTTLPEMLEVLSNNYNKRVEEARLFEVSCVYIPKSLPVTELPYEKPVLTMGMYGAADFYDLKGVVDELLYRLGIKDFAYEPVRDYPSFHPGRTAKLLIKGREAGVLGEIHPEVAQKFEAAERNYAAMLDIEPMVANASLKAQYKPLPKFPAVTRDIALLVKDEVLVKQIEDVIRQRSGRIFEDLKLFDVYKGKQVPEGMKSIAYSITFRAEDKTLTDEEVGKTMRRILDGLKDNVGAQLRE